ncbi:MAG: dimethylarginine dimethylaminohydrolase family protein [Gammaproteobacteria bacterium]
MSKTTRILMCPPDHFHVNYMINPWMKGNENQVSQEKAAEEWRNLRDTISRFAEVVEIEPRPGLPDMVFTANAGTVYRDQAVVTRFYHKERQGEEPHFKAWFEANGFTVHELPQDMYHEGAADALLNRGEHFFWAGHGIRTVRESQDYLHDWFGVPMELIRLIDERFYHIDTCCCPLAGGYLLYYPKAFDQASNRLIEAKIPADRRIAVNDDEAASFACNAVNIGNVVIMHQASVRIREQLGQAGFEVIETPVGEFLKAGGSTKCLTLKLTEPEGGA